MDGIELKIEVGIPLPSKRQGKIGASEVDSLLSKLKVGDSILCESRSQAAYLQGRLKRVGKLGTTRSEGENIRIWRVK